jgi:hypothetical protein
VNKIKFSHEYFKMPLKARAKRDRSYIISVCVVEDIMKQLPIQFLQFDTLYFVNGQSKLYPLDFKKGIIITIYTTGKIWTTIRRWTPSKEQYYKAMIGQEVEIEITEEVK